MFPSVKTHCSGKVGTENLFNFILFDALLKKNEFTLKKDFIKSASFFPPSIMMYPVQLELEITKGTFSPYMKSMLGVAFS